MSDWAARSPADLGALALSAIALALAARLLASLLVGLVLALLPGRRAMAVRLAWGRHAAPLARRLLAGIVPVALAGATAVPAGAAPIRRVYGPPWRAGPVPVTVAPPATVTAPTITAPTITAPALAASPAIPARVDRGPQAPRMHTVAPGDSFWSIAERHVLTWQDEATEHDLARYWVRLVEANTDRLPVPGDPDLLLPGTVLRLPPLPLA